MNKRDIEFLFLLIFFTRKKNKIKSGYKLAERCKRGGERLEKTDLYRVVAAVFRMWIVGSGGSSSNSSRWLHARNANSRNNRAFSLVPPRPNYPLAIFSSNIFQFPRRHFVSDSPHVKFRVVRIIGEKISWFINRDNSNNNRRWSNRVIFWIYIFVKRYSSGKLLWTYGMTICLAVLCCLAGRKWMLRVNATGRKVNGPCWGFNVEISSSQFVNGDKCRSINNGSSFEKLYLHLKNKIFPSFSYFIPENRLN